MSPRPCWILCTPRTGSSYLCELLNNTGVFPPFEDPRLSDRRGPIERGLAFNEWLRIFTGAEDLAANTPPFCKAIYHQFVEVMASVPLADRRVPGPVGYRPIAAEAERFVREKYHLSYVQACLPGIKFVKLIRDPASQTVSTYFARETGVYHAYTQEECDQFLRRRIPFPGDIGTLYGEVKAIQGVWDCLSERQQILTVDYDQLVADPAQALRQVLGFVGVDPDDSLLARAVGRTHAPDRRLFRMTRPDADRFVRYLRGGMGKIM